MFLELIGSMDFPFSLDLTMSVLAGVTIFDPFRFSKNMVFSLFTTFRDSPLWPIFDSVLVLGRVLSVD